MEKKYNDLVSGIVFLVFSAVAFICGQSIKAYTGYGNMGISARFMPQLMAVGMGVLSIVLIVNGIKSLHRHSGKETNEQPSTKKFSRKVILTALCIGVYIFLMPYLGFLISTALYLFFQMALLAPPEYAGVKNKVITAVISVCFSTAVYYIFVNVFTLILPQGILG